ncbi:helix-turn-helix domain-containing protein [Pseudoteredinibacter isoporae]|uniref:Transcriptional regulator GlxA family with amidase domain n=1 Tax=Pseudoteredinibacter isoporae TaxID=570281 RepID=A0A7X0JUM3_9GAMM|nr:transcriptional regulator GlxA family with amidase domain [Pseudoteredinibacter isoporae]NHO87529.1 helix-turn-helix domain-containing protein [Pseudoteredinibacter isoporae]NIB24140.1 helix-turn-helix domain-containing protein [Pseudoteredinibacter isoporae]
MPTITFVLCDHMLATGTTLPIEMLKAAESAALAQNRRAERLNIQTAAIERKSVMTRAGFAFQPDLSLPEVDQSDMIYLPALWRNPRPLMKSQPQLLSWLRQHYENGATISAVGTGCCLLAEAGLLDGKPATTHWHYFDQFQRDYPQVQLKRQYFITQASNLYCAASVNALADLTVHFIQRLYDRPTANHVERHFSHEIRRSYEESGFFEGCSNNHPDEDIVQAQIWLQDNYGKEVKLSDVAEKFDMSVRTFNRRFKSATGKSPLQYLQEVRIETAKDLLKTSNLSINEIAFRVGYQDMGHFTGLFKKLLATTPSEYRTTVRAKLFSVNQ